MSRNRVVGSIIKNPWIFKTKSLGTAKRSNEKDRWDMSCSNIFPGIITVWRQAGLKHLTLLIAWFVLRRFFCYAPLFHGTWIMLQSGPVVLWGFFFAHFLYQSYWYNIWQLFRLFTHSSLKPGIFHSIFFPSIFSKSIFKFWEKMLFKHQIYLTKSICKCRKTWIYVALRFVRKHVQW